MNALILALLLLTPNFVFGGELIEVVVKELKFDTYNDVWKKFYPDDAHVSYVTKADGSDERFNLYMDETLGVSVVVLSEANRAELEGHLSKFEDWAKKAAAKKLKLEKEIGKIKTKDAWFRMGDSYHPGDPISIATSFFSQKDLRYQFVMEFGEIQSSKNQFANMKPESKYLSLAQAKALRKALNRENVEKAVAVFVKKKAEADEFK